MKQTWLYPTLLAGVMFVLAALATSLILVLINPALEPIVGDINTPAPTQEILWASVDITKPRTTPIDTDTSVAPPPDALASAPLVTSPPPAGDLQASTPTNPPSLVVTEASVEAPEATETPGTLFMEIVADASMGQSLATDDAQVQYLTESEDERWIDVNLSEQRLYAYQGNTLMNSFLVSTGVAETPTVTGSYKIWTKVRIQDMSGPGYYLPNVPYVMYFYKDYGLHGTYWHNNFGTPMSRGCVNLTVEDAAWLFNWASVGTVVNVHY
jgi:lipoprotein-anchoring transpeptidase ErfK/SrfK